ncbi:7-carboxy-7-deazaguanine synthase [Alicyclobacillus contaminans]|uniref:7-carboxy-7-deazaguanine synthase QueE n=1 Tax=Alicyclobacillus contaminans TaxID=392016 RepID=UPI0003F70AE7|nr:7-carboxy-7-deazaguanine synthase QueE [Alicyclobacillus contaminans]GMA50078.1 7-carboxy-7-deazaguanine synthase [Alicyclobacillus contaminans]
MSIIPVMEIFGPTIQGEGMAIGRKTMFVRTAGCDYQCSWCDSKFTWDGSAKAVAMTSEEIWAELQRQAAGNFDYVTISGGNPALIRDAMAEFLQLLRAHAIRTGLETQGSVWRDWFRWIDDLTLSPKPPSSGMRTDWRVLDDIVERVRADALNASFKVVVFDDADYDYAVDVHRRWPDIPFFLSVGNEDTAAEGDVSARLLEQLRWLTERVTSHPEMNDVRVLPQLHVLLWGNRRGV